MVMIRCFEIPAAAGLHVCCILHIKETGSCHRDNDTALGIMTGDG